MNIILGDNIKIIIDI